MNRSVLVSRATKWQPQIMRRISLCVLLMAFGCDASMEDLDGAVGADAASDGGDSDSGSVRLDGGSTDGAVDAGEPPPPSRGCARLPAASGSILRATPADDLAAVVGDAPAGTTILLADGTYTSSGSDESSRRLIFREPGVTLRSESGDASRVIIDGEYRTNEIVYIVANDITIAELTITHAVDHLVHASGNGAETITGTRLHGVHFLDSGEQFVKVNGSGEGGYVDDGRLECSLFELTDEGRPNIERSPGGCYTGGIDAHSARGWRVANNRFVGIYCAGEGLAEHAVHFWRSARDTIVENNAIINCARGVGFGLDEGIERTYADDPYPGVGPVSHYDGIIRNNVIYSDIEFHDTGIELARARGSRVFHNTVVSEGGAGFYSSIDYRFDTTQVEIRNNLVRRITVRNGASASLEANLENTPSSYFIDVGARDFHLTASAVDAIDMGVVVAESGVDIDGESRDRGAAPDLGADER